MHNGTARPNWIDDLLRRRYSQLSELENSFGEWYRFTATANVFTATHRTTGRQLHALTAAALREAVADHYAARAQASA